MSSPSPIPQRRSLRVRITRPSTSATTVSSGSEPSDEGEESDSHDGSYQPNRKRQRGTSSEPDEPRARRLPHSTPKLLPAAHRALPENDLELMPLAPQAHTTAVRGTAVSVPQDERFATLHRSAHPPPETDNSGWNAPAPTAASFPRKETRISARTRIQEAQKARQAEMEASTAWADAVVGSDRDPEPVPDFVEVEHISPPVRSQRSGRTKLSMLRGRSPGSGRSRGHGKRDAWGPTSPLGLSGTSERVREARELRQSEVQAKQAWASFHARRTSARETATGGGGLSLAPTEDPDHRPSGDSDRESAQGSSLESAHESADEPGQDPATVPGGPFPPSKRPVKTHSGQASATNEPHSLTSWLGLAPKGAEIPDPITSEATQLVDRDSLFIGYVYPLESARTAEVGTVLNHLARRVHPQVPVHLLPPALRSAPPSKRGSSHDMYALRVLQLRPGRTGNQGAGDYSVVEEAEDDGEKWGAQRVLTAMREQGIVDAICIVSRWYGGVMLGPARFTHIQHVATQALQGFRTQEQVAPLVAQLVQLDNQLASLRLELLKLRGKPPLDPLPSNEASTEAKYAHVRSLDQAERLLTARQAAVRAQTRILAQARARADASAD